MSSAAKSGRMDIVDIMLQQGATDYDYEMWRAAKGGHMNIVELMLQLGA